MIVKRDKYTIHILDDVLIILNKYIQDKDQNESGGIILGSVHEKNHIYIQKISEPNVLDKSSRCSFERDKNTAQIIVNEIFNESDGKIIYLGEWHTHPEKNPLPSNVDIKMIKQQYNKNIINVNFLLLLIQGTESLYLAIYDGNQIINT